MNETAQSIIKKFISIYFDIQHRDCEGDIAIATGRPTLANAIHCGILHVEGIIAAGAGDVEVGEELISGFTFWNGILNELKAMK